MTVIWAGSLAPRLDVRNETGVPETEVPQQGATFHETISSRWAALIAALALWYDESFRTASGCWLWRARAVRWAGITQW